MQALLQAIVGHVSLPEVDGFVLSAECRQAALFDCNGLARHHSLLMIPGVRDVGILADLVDVVGTCAIGSPRDCTAPSHNALKTETVVRHRQ